MKPDWLKKGFSASHTVKGFGSLVSSAFVLGFLLINQPSQAAPCYPNDPDGSNPGNLCLTYPPSWSPLPNTSTDQPPFVQGLGKEAYYGYPTSPTQPGRVIGTTTGYWTNVEAVNGSTAITDSTGKTITAP